MKRPMRVRPTTLRTTGHTVVNQNRFPDTKNCRTKFLGQSVEFSACLVQNPVGCIYAGRVDASVYCHHPNRRDFEKTGKP
jgi:hypothetical protein